MRIINKLENKLKDIMLKSQLYKNDELDKMDNITVQFKFLEHFEILETSSLMKEKREVYYILKSSLNEMLTSDKAFKN